jgi:dTDP-4-amino-4,6-dideoxygalactose transaminase
MMILFNDFKQDSQSLLQEELDAVERVLKSGWYVLGNEVSSFEKDWADYIGVKHAIGVGNGMDALEIGLRALDIGPGDEVITTPMTAFATVLSILRAGAKPVLADINPNTAMLDLESVSRCVTPRTRAVMLVHLYGQTGPIETLSELCESKGIYLIEDCAQAHGAKIKDKMVGSYGVYSGWSFYPTKNLGAIGDGGALTTNSDEVADRARRLRNYGQSIRYHHTDIGLNSRLDEMQAAILRVRFKLLPKWTERRRQIAHAYAAGIRNEKISLMSLPKDVNAHVHHLFVLTSSLRNELERFLGENDVQSLIHYPIPIHQQPPCREIERDPLGLVNTEKHAAECLSLPCHPGLSDVEIARVIELVNEF